MVTSYIRRAAKSRWLPSLIVIIVGAACSNSEIRPTQSDGFGASPHIPANETKLSLAEDASHIAPEPRAPEPKTPLSQNRIESSSEDSPQPRVDNAQAAAAAELEKNSAEPQPSIDLRDEPAFELPSKHEVRAQNLAPKSEAAAVSSESPSDAAVINSPQPLIIAPAISVDEIVLDETYFVIHYSQSVRLAKFVEYNLDANHLRQSFVKRRDHFHADDQIVKLGLDAVQPGDYRYSGYDRGHLAPSGDFAWSEDANEATFSMANMTPQTPGLNRTAWKRLEEQVRAWACGEEEIRVVTGPVLSADMKSLPSHVPVPEKFFKVILDEKPPGKAIGFIMSQEETKSSDYLHDVVTMANVEALTGLQFFKEIPTEERIGIETHADLSQWRAADCIRHEEASPDGTPIIREKPDVAEVPASTDHKVCSSEDLRPASISGCCSHHGGVMGPKHSKACCDSTNHVYCNDGSVAESNSCHCL